MKIPPIQIRNEGVVADIRELARLTHKPITEAVATAVRSELTRAQGISTSQRDARLRAIRTAVEQFKRSPVLGPVLTDDDLYDEHGLPR
jgi:hypothetical protein